MENGLFLVCVSKPESREKIHANSTQKYLRSEHRTFFLWDIRANRWAIMLPAVRLDNIVSTLFFDLINLMCCQFYALFNAYYGNDDFLFYFIKIVDFCTVMEGRKS